MNSVYVNATEGQVWYKTPAIVFETLEKTLLYTL